MESYSIGRDESSNVIVNDPSNMVSRRHATLLVNGRKMTITDHSTNGTYINGIRIAPNTPVPVTRNDVINFAQAADLNWATIPDKSRNIWLIAAIIAIVAIVGGIAVYIVNNRIPAISQNAAVQQQDSLDTSKMSVAIEALEKDIVALSDLHKKAMENLGSLQKQCDAKSDNKQLRKVINICHDAEILLTNINIGEYKEKVSRLKENLSDRVKDTQSRIDALKKQVDEAKGNLEKAQNLLTEVENKIKKLPNKSTEERKNPAKDQKKDSVQTVMNPNPIIY